MDGNQSLLDVVPHVIHCAYVPVPALIINIALGLPANMCVMWLILAGPGDKAAEMFSLNQAVCEVVICVANVVLLVAVNTTTLNVEIFLWYSVRFNSGIILSGRPLFISCVCLERYLAVVHPVTFLKYKPLRYRLAGIIISWLTVLVGCLTLGWLPCPTTFYTAFSMGFFWFLVQLFCCVQTLRALLKPGPGEGNQERNGMHSAKMKAFRIIAIMAIALVLCHLPFVMPTILLGHISEEDSSILFCIANYIALIPVLIPPLVYISSSGKMQHCIKDKV